MRLVGPVLGSQDSIQTADTGVGSVELENVLDFPFGNTVPQFSYLPSGDTIFITSYEADGNSFRQTFSYVKYNNTFAPHT